MITRVLAICLMLLPSLHTLRAQEMLKRVDCAATDQQMYISNYNKHLDTLSFDEAAKALENLVACLPMRGDLRIEQLRLYLLIEDWASVQSTYDWLAAAGMPEGAKAMVDSWITSSASPTQPPVFAWRKSVELETGVSSNPRLAPNTSNIPVWSTIGSGTLRLSDKERKESSSFVGINMTLQRELSPDLAFDLQLSTRHYNRIDVNTSGLSLSLAGMVECEKTVACRWELGSEHLLGTSQVNSYWLGVSRGYRSHAVSGKLTHAENDLGDQWLTATGDMRARVAGGLVRVALDHEQPVTERPSGARVRMTVGAERSLAWNMTVYGQLSKEWDKGAYAPSFWGNERRDLLVKSVGLTFKLDEKLRIVASGLRSESHIPLYDRDAISLGLSYKF